MKKICVITGTRAEYGLLRRLMRQIERDERFVLQIIATGMHLSPEFGLTYKNILEDGFAIDAKIEMLLSSDTPSGISKSIGLGVIGFSDAFERFKPDLIVVLGDRFEIFAAAAAAIPFSIPIAHVHGGEATEGLIDEAIRHSVTKMSHIHFVAHEEYRRRVIQLGENPNSVFNVGGLGVDELNRLNLLDKFSLEKQLKVRFKEKNLLITFHPVTLGDENAKDQMNELLMSLEALSDTLLIFTMPNADTNGRSIIELVASFASRKKNAVCFTSLGQLKYLSCLKFVDAVVGNSSSGLLEAPSFRIGTINIGDRQRGRIQATSVINCEAEEKSISSAIANIYTKRFRNVLKKTSNPYGPGGASDKILNILRELETNNIVKKSFYDLGQK